MTENLLKGWKSECLSEVLEVLESGGRPKGGVKGIKEGIPSLGGEHLNSQGKFNFNKIRYVPEDFYDSMTQGKIRKKDVLIVKDGATTGKTSFVGNDFPFKDAAVNEHVFIARHNNKLLGKSLFYYLFSHEGQLQFKENISGSAQGGINRGILKNIWIKYPESKTEQKFIVDEIEKQFTRLDAAVKSLQEIKSKLEVYRKSVLNVAFSNKTIRWITLVDIIDLTAGNAFKKKEYAASGLRLFQIANVTFGKTKWEQLNYLPESYADKFPSLILKEGDVLMALNRPLLQGKLKIAILQKKDIPCILYQRVGRFDFNDKKEVDRTYFFYYLQSPIFIRILEESLQGVDQPFINKSKLLKFKFPMININIQKKIIQKIESQFSVIDKLEESVDNALLKAEYLRKSILKSAFEGKLVKYDGGGNSD